MRDTIINLAAQVYDELGSGFSECVYHRGLETMLRLSNINYESERIAPIVFKGHVIGHFRIDLVVDSMYIVELKNIKYISESAKRQLEVYMQSTGIKNGLLINFPPPDGKYDHVETWVKQSE